MASPRVAKTYTLSLDAVNALEAHAEKTGDKLSRLVEQGIRMVCALPAEPQEEGDSGLSDTRATVVVREVLASMPPEPWPSHEIARVANLSFGVVERALGELQRKGEVHFWGHGGIGLNQRGERVQARFGGFGEGEWMVNPCVKTWCLQTPTEKVGELLAMWKKAGGKRAEQRWDLGALGMKVSARIQELVLSVDNIEPVLEVVEREMGTPAVEEVVEVLPATREIITRRFESATQREDRLNAAYAKRKSETDANGDWRPPTPPPQR